ncbi:YraN family protein [Notoacmeibacter sp. MSK16QG-6]|uniref:YraN family protein n=1 Tax=Notoacmeibacter sp. MSK16QG-6 TaxID=2957982 RepID=UPI00209DB3DC|nr:YraN family protein [Notoacmeibacter sp. MSK16QG-6]MCP1198905.1 YraN family protein [Notoacmeibacter sp. MSK16QG-6]
MARKRAGHGIVAKRRFLKRGARGETLAAWLLRLKGYRIVGRNVRTRLGEIDIVAKRRNLIAIVEVKARPTLQDAMEAVTPAAQKRISNAADLWLAKRRDAANLSIRFDIIAVVGRRLPIHIENAWNG